TIQNVFVGKIQDLLFHHGRQEGRLSCRQKERQQDLQNIYQFQRSDNAHPGQSDVSTGKDTQR
ncbi:hypothetical protein ACJBRG_11295, partial [Streptococcus suis]